MAIRVLLIDNQRAVRAGLRALLDRRPGMEVVGEADDVPAAIQLAERCQPAVVLIGVPWQGAAGSEAVKCLSTRLPHVGVIVLSASQDKTFVANMLTAGAHGCVARQSDPGALYEAIERVASDEMYIGPQARGAIVEARGETHRASVAMSGPRTPAQAGGYLTFVLGDSQYGVELGKVREIIGHIHVTVAPDASLHIKGVIDFRGKEIPVMDLRARFGMAAAEATEQTCVVVVEVTRSGRPHSIGIVIDRLQGVLDIAPTDIDEAPQSGAPVDAYLLLGTAHAGKSVTFLLDIDRVLDSEATAS